MPHRGRTTAILLATGAVVVVAAAVVSFKGDVLRGWFPHQSDADRIQGKWKVVSARSGRKSNYGRWSHLVFEGEKILYFRGDRRKQTFGYRLDEDHQPGWFDILLLPSDKSNLGIYELKRDTLRICWTHYSPGKRPTAFESKAGSKTTLFVLQRE